MAKGSRKKKEKKKDFQKVKLKIGKRKPQAENFTVTTFKSQAIHIRDQLKSEDNIDVTEPVTQRKKNIHDLICHLNHYNVTIRQSSIAGMKELLAAHPALIPQHLPSLIDSLSILITDKEDAVRKSGISLIQLVLEATPSDRITPFFPVLSAHLSCAMTHIQEDIQLDSLAILDLVLRYYPRLLTTQSQELLTIFVQQISQQRKTSISWVQDEAGGSNELAVKPGSKISSHKWRQKVLLRLRQFLTALLQEHYSRQSTTNDSRIPDDNTKHSVIVSNQSQTFVPIFVQSDTRKGKFVLSSMSSSSPSSANDFTKPENLLGFVQSLVPLLLQCWMEVAPKSHDQAQVHLHMVALEILDGVLSVIQLLWRWMQSICEEKQDFSCMKQLHKLYLQKFIKHLLSCFPYTSHNAPVKSKHAGKGATPISVVSLNLACCEIMSYFMLRSNMEDRWLRKIMVYVIETCMDGSKLYDENMQSLLGVVHRLVKALPSKESVSDLLQAVYSMYETCHNSSSNKTKILLCLDELLSAHRNEHPSSIVCGSKKNQWYYLDESHSPEDEQSKLFETLKYYWFFSEPHTLTEEITWCHRKPSFFYYFHHAQLQVLFKLWSVDSLFLKSLPDLVMELASQKALEILLSRAAQHQPEALRCIQKNLKAFIDPQDGILLHIPENLQVSVIHLIHYADPLDLVTLRSLAMCCHDNRISANNVAHLINVLSMRFISCSDTSINAVKKLAFCLSDFISFLFSVSIGCSSADLSRLVESTQQMDIGIVPDILPPCSLTSLGVTANSSIESNLHRHSTILKTVCLSYNVISSKRQMWDMMQTLINRFLNRHTKLPYHTIYALLYTINHLNSQDADWSRETSNKLTDCCLATLYRVVSDDTRGIVIDDWAEALWYQTVMLLLTSTQILIDVMHKIHSCITGLTDVEHVQHVAMVMIRLLQKQQLSSLLVKESDCVMQAVRGILNHHLATGGHRWATELQYEASVLLQTQK